MDIPDEFFLFGKGFHDGNIIVVFMCIASSVQSSRASGRSILACP